MAIVFLLTLLRQYLVPRHGLAEALCAMQRIRKSSLTEPEAARVLGSVLQTYHWIRLPFAQGTGDCLKRSLSLTAVLRSRGIDAALCLGVRKFPFSAHAWVEVGDTVVNESLSVLAQHVPIARF
jgi:hypothetical protein